MKLEIKEIWPLLLGMFFMMIGNGLQGTLLSIRATIEGFGTTTTGWVMSGYFLGIFFGSIFAPKLIQKVGHIRVFAAFASMASVVILIHSLYINPFSWFLMRLINGLCFAGLYVVAESWVNARASNQSRGKILSIYMLVVLLGLTCAQLLLNLADLRSLELFILISVVISFGLIPILLTEKSAPEFKISTPMSLINLLKIAPVSSICVIFTGVTHGTLFSIAPIYALKNGFSTSEISLFMATIMAGGCLLQWPLGLLSDKVSRPVLLMALSLIALACSVLAYFMDSTSLIFYPNIFVFGGILLPMYSICIAYANDGLQSDQIIGASASLVMLSGIGLFVGPVIMAMVMEFYGTHTFFIFYSIIFASIVLLIFINTQRKPMINVEDQTPAIVTGQIGTPISEFIENKPRLYIKALQLDLLTTLDSKIKQAKIKLKKKNKYKKGIVDYKFTDEK